MEKKMGRPEKEISQTQFEMLCEIQCTKLEICAVLEVTEKTLNKWCKNIYGETFSLVFKQKRKGGLSSLRRKQWLLAEANPSMAIFLGKNYLNQSDDPTLKDIKLAELEIKKQELELKRMSIENKLGLEEDEEVVITFRKASDKKKEESSEAGE